MRIGTIAVLLVALVSLTIWAQAPRGQRGQAQATPQQGGVFSAADLAALVARQPKDRTGNATFLQLAPYNVNMEHRVNMPQNASIHDKEAELFYVVDGTGTIVLGGQLMNATKNGDNSTGSGIEGGAAKKIGKGDFIFVPQGQAHWFSAIDGELTLMSLHLPRTN
jgi:mannose-6-phosphate isomerase-like protein (cupin superfamily)